MSDWSFETKLVHSGHQQDPDTGASELPVYQSVSFQHDSAQKISNVFHGKEFGYIYSRIGNPTVAAFEQRITAAESGLGTVAVSSGMAALSIIIEALTQVGDEIISSKSLFGGTYYLLQELVQTGRIKVRWVDTTDIASYKAAITSQTKGIFCESIGNPKLDVPNLTALSELAKKAGVPLVVDGTCSTPVLLNAKEAEIDIMWHSATKWIGGHGAAVGGLIVDTGRFQWSGFDNPMIQDLKGMGQLAFLARCRKLRSNRGCCLGPQDAFLLNLGIETMSLRVKQQCQNALALAKALQAHPAVASVSYPGLSDHPDHQVASQLFSDQFGAVLCVRLHDKAASFQFLDQLQLIKQLANLGDTCTLAVHPESTIYRNLSVDEQIQAGVYPDQVRLSVGIESIEDLIKDCQQSLDQLKQSS